MKRGLLLFLFLFPSLAFAKYCPACFHTFQARTPAGQAKIIYRWLDQTMKGKAPLKLSDTKRLFSKSVTININGKRVARNPQGVYKFFSRMKQRQKLLESHLDQLLVDGKNVVLRYHFVTQKKRHVTVNTKKHRRLAIVILHFQNHQLKSWWEVQHTIVHKH